ncbi:MAG: TMEM165/GDT1 family protein [Blastocatellia bacterium]|nr:TMEM165/GDT1 family protein [Blastocatellia bacterium]MCS7158254.1 TMEM165/GDT1 family protein [Blastocatellia bacterium]MCX7753092.1 TMEM165/GDT1 family protein [Blastocatellia bacterium]MDW8169407.1 TMEM165/GDT1 family protein [Acidobacteriota bacterium]MDW8256475.1 TMEM165/GDT1 family protein [Acidobacteriota bacterium]
MNWHAFVTTFALILLAEMGDKTQLTAISMVSRTKSPLAVFLGASLAMAVVTLLGVLGGTLLTRYVPEEYLQKIAAAAFILIGLAMLLGKW